MLPLLAITFNSCSDDDDNNGNNGDSGKLVKSIVEGNMVSTFEYDSQNRLTKSIHKEDGRQDVFNTFTYENNKLAYTLTDLNNPEENGTIVLYFDDAGYLINIDDEGYYDTFTYVGGYLNRTVGSLGYTQSFTWNNGNITSITSSDGYEWAYDYSDIANSLNIRSGIFPHEWFLVSPKSKGVHSEQFPSSCKEYKNGTLQSTIAYSYTLDNDGYLTQITVTENGSEEKILITYY
jgi:hypothetical protein